MVTPSPLSNLIEYSVSDLASAIKRSLETGFDRVRVRGELSRVATPASGHLYTALKDADAVLDAVCWRTTLSRLKIKPEEGLEVICTGRITTYPARSNYQLVIEQMELAGVGALLKMIEDRRVKLAAEGLFDTDRKRALPVLPRTIGVITSPTGAVIRDILHRLTDRFPVTVLVWPVAVQGDQAAAQVVAAIEGFNRPTSPFATPDVLIVARGGGSIEDLMPFNDESVVRAVAASRIPIISAVGHETDTTLIDYAADVRAPTPTAAAEFAVPVRADLIAGVGEIGVRLAASILRQVRDDRRALAALEARLGTPARILENPIQRLDFLQASLVRAMETRLGRVRLITDGLGARLRHPHQILQGATQRWTQNADLWARLGARLLADPYHRLDTATRMMESLSFQAVLKRGFAVVRDGEGQVITRGQDLATAQKIRVLLGDQTERSATVD